MIDDSDLEKIGRILSQAVRENFTGNIQINFFKGGVSNIVKQQSIKLAEITK